LAKIFLLKKSKKNLILSSKNLLVLKIQKLVRFEKENGFSMASSIPSFITLADVQKLLFSRKFIAQFITYKGIFVF